MRRAALAVVLTAAGLSTGCATAMSALLGAAVCGDSDACRSDFVSAGAEVDSEIIGSAIASAVESDPEGGAEPSRPRQDTSGAEEYATPPSGAYFHCVDGEGHHVIELVAPSALDARLLCAAQLGVPWTEPGADALCDCGARG